MVIIAAVDRSDRNEVTIREAARLGAAFDEPIHIVHVLTQSEFMELERTPDIGESDPVDMDRIRTVAREIASEAGESIDQEWQPVGLLGDPVSRLVEYAENQDAGYIVIRSKKRSPTGKAVFGSTSQSILLNAECPVVSVLSK